MKKYIRPSRETKPTFKQWLQYIKTGKREYKQPTTETVYTIY